jgi:hypothetical protein
MPEIPVNQFFPGEDMFPPDEPVGHEDMLFAPKVPEKVIEEEKTPEQLRLEGFHGEALSYRESYAGPAGGRYSIAMDDVCRFEGWPRRHTVIGRNCPHGMLETLEMQRNAEQG